MGYWRQRADRGLAILPQGNQEPLLAKEMVGKPHVSLGWAGPWNVIHFPFSALTWLGESKGIQPVKTGCLLMVMIWLELYTLYSCNCHYHLSFLAAVKPKMKWKPKIMVVLGLKLVVLLTAVNTDSILMDQKISPVCLMNGCRKRQLN